ncbi:MAG: enoyl-CoA hydratase/isomerase family protein [Alphaproteobacteria bacterium]
MADYKTLLVNDADGLRTIVLNRPKVMNAANPEMLRELAAVFADIESNDAVRCVLLTGEGKAFCAGRDLSSAKPNEDAYAIITREINPVLKQIYDCSKPTIAAVNGVAMGVGLGIALACDIVYAADNARLSSPFANLGVALDSGGHFFLPRLIGYGRAMEMVYTADTIRGRQAEAWGLVNRAVPGTKLREWATSLGRRIAAGPLRAFAGQKKLMKRSPSLDYTACMDEEARLQASLVGAPEYKEGLAAFREKRRPNFRRT